MSTKSDVDSFVRDAFAAGFFGILILIIIAAIALFLPAAIFVWLWNAFIVAIFTSAPVLTYWQGFVILLVSGMIFGRRG